MTIWDERILEILNFDGPSTPTKLSERDYIEISQSQVSRRLSTLNEHKLVTSLGNGVYQISEKGEYYLEGLYDAEAMTKINRNESGNDSATEA